MGLPAAKLLITFLFLFVIQPKPTVGLAWLLENYGVGKCMHVIGENPADNSAVELVTCRCPAVADASTAPQVWGEGWSEGAAQTAIKYYLTSTTHDMVLTVNGGSTSAGAIINTYQNLQQTNQLFQVVNSNGAFGAPGNLFQIKNVKSGLCLTAQNGGAYVDQQICLGTALGPNQTWRIFG